MLWASGSQDTSQGNLVSRLAMGINGVIIIMASKGVSNIPTKPPLPSK